MTPSTPPAGWLRYPNLRNRPHAPAAGRGRLQVQIRRAFIGHAERTSRHVYDFAYPRHRGRVVGRWEHSVWRILRVIADRVGRAPTIGRPWLWRLREPLE
jgi:hypothetical protein